MLYLSNKDQLSWQIDDRPAAPAEAASGEHMFSASIKTTEKEDDTVFFVITIRSEFAGEAAETETETERQRQQQSPRGRDGNRDSDSDRDRETKAATESERDG